MSEETKKVFLNIFYNCMSELNQKQLNPNETKKTQQKIRINSLNWLLDLMNKLKFFSNRTSSSTLSTTLSTITSHSTAASPSSHEEQLKYSIKIFGLFVYSWSCCEYFNEISSSSTFINPNKSLRLYEIDSEFFNNLDKYFIKLLNNSNWRSIFDKIVESILYSLNSTSISKSSQSKVFKGKNEYLTENY
jgi:hypothetical protein